MSKHKDASDSEQPSSKDKLAYRIDEACHALGLGRTSLYQLIKDGRLQTVKVAGRRLVPTSALRELVEQARDDG